MLGFLYAFTGCLSVWLGDWPAARLLLGFSLPYMARGQRLFLERYSDAQFCWVFSLGLIFSSE